jgi:methyltransferase family protein
VYPKLVETAARQRHRFVWNVIRSPEELGRVRMAAMGEFLDDYEAGRRAGRYVPAALPQLPFADGSFDLALCSHFLFLYSGELSLDYHRRSVLELCRVAGEVRIFPLLDMKGKPSGHLAPVMEALRGRGLEARVERVPYEFQKGGDEMLRIAGSA